jgi:class 3 adenylate cyclase
MAALAHDAHRQFRDIDSQFEGTLDQFSGDGIMVFFNDPVPIPDPAERAVKMAVAMREAAGSLIAAWRRRDRALGFGAGIALLGAAQPALRVIEGGGPATA